MELVRGKRTTLLIKVGAPQDQHAWLQAFRDCAPELEVRLWSDDAVDPADVDYAMVWMPTPGRLARFPNLRLILSAAAGVDHILADPELPQQLPIVRMITTETVDRMSDFVLMSALALTRDLPALLDARHHRIWEAGMTGRLASDTAVGIMGLGQLGAATASRLAAAGFPVAGWSRSVRSIKGVRCFAGNAELDSFLSQSKILVNLLPHTPETVRLIDQAVLERLPPGAAVINVGRASHLDHDALIALLDAGHLSGAVLDVFDTEPLPADSVLWSHPKIIATPHIASTVSPQARARRAAGIIRAHLNQEPLAHLFDRKRGY